MSLELGWRHLAFNYVSHKRAKCLAPLPLSMLTATNRAPSSKLQAPSYGDAGKRVPATDY